MTSSRRALLFLAVLLACAVAGFAASPARAASGDLDPGFGTGGIVDVPPGHGSYLSILVQPDGKILAGGHTAPGLFFASVVRLNPDGTLDQSFGAGGVTTWDFEPDRPDSSGLVFTLELLPDGKILAGGTTGAGFALARLTSDGTLDSSFGIGGVSTPAFGEGVFFDLAVQPDGSILAAGRAGPAFGTDSRLGLGRFLANGAPDAAFGTGGFTSASFADGYLATAVLRPDGSVLAGGGSAGFADFQVARYGPGGVLDTSFGVGGFTTTDFSPSDVVEALAVQPDGRIVAAGASINRGDDFALARYMPDGTLDSSFGQGGKLETELMPFDQALAFDLALQPDGKIVAAGCSRNCDRLGLARYMSDGSLDPTFGDTGVSVIETVEDTSAIALQPDGKIVASAGGHFLPSPLGTTVVRVIGDTPPGLPIGNHDRYEGIVGPFGCAAEGWAVDPNDRYADLAIRVLADGAPVAEGVADLFRQDLVDAGVSPDGLSSFYINFWGLVTSNQPHLITAQARDVETLEWVTLGSPKELTCVGTVPDPEEIVNPKLSYFVAVCDALGVIDVTAAFFADDNPLGGSTSAFHAVEDNRTLIVFTPGTDEQADDHCVFWWAGGWEPKADWNTWFESAVFVTPRRN